MDLIVVGGAAGDVAQGVAVDGGDPVVHAVEAAGVDVVGIGHGGDVHICPAVGDGAPQHAGGHAAGPGEALDGGHADLAGDGAVADVDAGLVKRIPVIRIFFVRSAVNVWLASLRHEMS